MSMLVLDLVDMNTVAPNDMSALDEPIVARCMRRVIDSLEDPNGIISAFQSFVGFGESK